VALNAIEIIKRRRGGEKEAAGGEAAEEGQEGPLSSCESLQRLDLSGNFVSKRTIRETVGSLRSAPVLENLWLSGCPVAVGWKSGYRSFVVGSLPKLKELVRKREERREKRGERREERGERREERGERREERGERREKRGERREKREERREKREERREKREERREKRVFAFFFVSFEKKQKVLTFNKNKNRRTASSSPRSNALRPWRGSLI